MPQSAEQLGQDLTVVHSFFLFLLESALENEVPVPPLIAHDPEVLRRFVLLLDLAVTPQMIRDGLKRDEQRGAGESLLRFFAGKQRRRREDQDKVDVIATALFRMSVKPDQPLAFVDEDDLPRTLQFEEELKKIYGDLELPKPRNEHMQLVREFQFLRDEVADFRHFDELIDSGVIQKVREIKQTLDASFLHPSVLAPIASYNHYFGRTFDALFKRATQEVKSFAHKVQQDGGSIMSRVDGDVIVKQLAEVDESKILNEEYGRAQENLRHVSKLKKAVDNRRFGKGVPQAAPAPAASINANAKVPTTSLADSVAGGAPSQPAVQRPAQRLGPEPPAYAMPRSSSSVAEVEMQKLLSVQMTIRSFVRAADPSAAQTVPLPNGNIQLSAAEVEAFRADYGNEKSFRADYVGALIQFAALDARMGAELEEFQRTRYTAYNWKPHADALAHLLTVTRTVAEQAMQISATAQQRGLADKVKALNDSMEKVRVRARAATEALQSIGSNE